MPLIPTKTPEVVKSLFPNYIWNIDTLEKEIYLTFDDGPTPEITHWTLETLAKYNAKATFFCIGANIEKYPDIFQDILKEGHSIGNHTQHHIKGWKTKTKDYIEDIETCNRVFSKYISISETSDDPLKPVNLFRPPYGKITRKQGKKLLALAYKIIMWDVLAFDWDSSITEEDCANNVLSKAKNGSIVVFHDSVKASKNMQYALPRVLEYFTNQGYVFKALNIK